MHNSDSDETFEDYRQKRKFPENTKSVERALNEINAYTKKDLNSIEECVKYVKYLYDNSKKQPKNSRSQHDEEIEKLEETIEDLQDKLKSNEKKFTRNLHKKDSEIKELKEELESLEKAKSPKDNKEKFQLKELKDRNLELQENLKDKDDVCAESERNNKSLAKKIDSLTEKNETLSEKLKEMGKQMKKETKELKEIISNKQNEVEYINDGYEKALKEKHAVIVRITENMQIKNNENEVLDRKLTEKALELDECQKSLQNEKSKSKDLEMKSTLYENKIKQLEIEIRNIRINDFQQKNKPESWHPHWWNRHIKEMKRIQIQCTRCNRMFDVDKIKDHVDDCVYNYI